MADSIFTCDSDIRLETPFPEQNLLWALWANQNCKDFDLLLTIVLDTGIEKNLVGYLGADLSD